MNKEYVDRLIEENGYIKKIYGFALTRFSALSLAEELAADIVCEVYRSFISADEIVNPDGYVYRISCNVYSKHIRRMKNENTLSVEELSVPIPSPREEDGEIMQRLRREISLLSARQRSIIYMHYYDKRSIAEIGASLGISSGTVKWHLFDARKKLKEGLDMNNNYTEQLTVNPIYFSNMGHGGNPGSTGDTKDMFDTRLKQNIAYSCYYTPLTLEEISRCVGVPAAYVSDELKKLVEYAYIDKLDNTSNPKYRTNMMIDDFRNVEDEHGKKEDKLYREGAELLCDKLFPKIFRKADEAEDFLGFECGGDKNFLKYNLVPLVLKGFFESADIEWELWEKCAVKRPDGGEFIAFANVTDDCCAAKNEDGHNEYWFCGWMTRGDNNYKSLQLDCRYADRCGGWRDNLSEDWTSLAKFIKSGCDKNAVTLEEYKRLCDKSYIADDKATVMYAAVEKCKDGNWFEEFVKSTFGVPDEIYEAQKKYDELSFELDKPYYPEHMHTALRLTHSSFFSTGLMTVYVIEELLKREMLSPLTDEEKKTVFSILVFEK